MDGLSIVYGKKEHHSYKTPLYNFLKNKITHKALSNV